MLKYPHESAKYALPKTWVPLYFLATEKPIIARVNGTNIEKIETVVSASSPVGTKLLELQFLQILCN